MRTNLVTPCCEVAVSDSFESLPFCPNCEGPCEELVELADDNDLVNRLIANEREYVPREPYAQPGAWPTAAEVATFALIVIALGAVAIVGRVTL